MAIELTQTFLNNWPMYCIVALISVIVIMSVVIMRQKTAITGLKTTVTGLKNAVKTKDKLNEILTKQHKTDSSIIAKNTMRIVSIEIDKSIIEEKHDLLKFDYDLLTARLYHKKLPVIPENLARLKSVKTAFLLLAVSQPLAPTIILIVVAIASLLGLWFKIIKPFFFSNKEEEKKTINIVRNQHDLIGRRR